MDPFEVRMEFISLVSKLTSSVASISKVASFALKHAQKCSDDLWDCYLDEVHHATLNSRINLLYLLDAVLDREGPKVVVKHAVGGAVGQGSYRALVERDLGKVVDSVVPDSREGVLNWMSAIQVLRSWKTRRLLDADVLDAVTADLENRKASLHANESDATAAFANFSRNDILRRIEDDRERHKRLRERLWVLPVPSTIFPATLSASVPPSSSQKPSPISPASPFEPPPSASTPSSRAPVPPQAAGAAAAIDKTLPSTAGRGPELALEIEFDQLWEASEEERRLAIGPEDGESSSSTGAADADGREPKRRRRWLLAEQERDEMRSERERCFNPPS
ncbi:hypothetical protein JCM1840_004221 [Sporobolomyces johnsonii]